MKYITIFLFLGILMASCSQKVAESTADTTYHGDKITADNAIAASELSAMMAETGAATLKVKGSVEDVCQKKGCWMKMKVADGSEMMVRFKDYGFFVPVDATGKTAILEGKAFNDTISVEDLRHYAEDAGKTPEEIEKITEPEITLAFEATGVIIEK